MTKHTPGVWGCLGMLVETPPAKEQLRRIDSGELPMKVVVICSTENSGYIPREEAEANARLIAAAPDLLEACQAILAEHDNPNGHAILFDSVADILRAAVAKATGGE